MKDKLKSKGFCAILLLVSTFLTEEKANLKELKKTDETAYRERVKTLSKYGFIVHTSEMTREPMKITFGEM